MIFLAGDVGATKTNLGLFRLEGAELKQLDGRIYRTHDFSSLDAAVSEFMRERPAVNAACFGVPGPVVDGIAHTTNLPWEVSEPSVSATLGKAATRLVNDLAATAHGMLHLRPGEIVELNKGEARHSEANIAVIAAGTGLGEAGLIAVQNHWFAVPSEGGHCDFAPRGAEQIALLGFLEREFGHASFERALSGPGLHNIYRFLLETSDAPEPQWLREQMGSADASAVVSEVALANRDPRCVHALELFVEIYGAEAANLALKFLAFGGLYVGGGIAPKILPVLQRGAFMRAFISKGRLNPALEQIPVRVSLNEAAALLGAAHLAASMAPR